MSYASLRQVRNEQALLIHDERDAHSHPDLTEDVPNYWIEEKLTDFVLDWSNRLTLEPFIVSSIFFGPERTDEWVFDLPNNPFAVSRVCEQPVDSEQRRVLTVEQRRYRIVEDVFEARSPRIVPDALERAYDPGCDQVPFIRGHIGQKVEPYRMLKIAGIEVAEVVGPARGNVIENFFRQIPVWVDEPYAVPKADVLENQIP